MSGFIPSYLLRTRTLSRARTALVQGDCELALEILAHPALALSRRADLLRSKVLGSLWRTVSGKSRAGRTDSVIRLIDLVARENPESADDWSRRLLPERAGPSPAERPSRVTSPSQSAPFFHLAVDDVGEFLVACRSELVLGHSRGGRADLGFLADLESAQARFVLEESFHGGPRWHLEGLVPGAFEIVGVECDSARVALDDQNVVRLGANFEFQFLAPDPASSSAVLKLLHGVECEGASRVLLFGEGEAGRVRMGARVSRHFVVPSLEEEVTLVQTAGELRIYGEEALRVWPEVKGSGEAPAELRLQIPPLERFDFVGAPRSKNRPPFSFSITPGGDR